MYYVTDSNKPFEQAATDLAEAVGRHGFGVLHVHDLGSTLRGKGVDFAQQCKIFEVCNPQPASRVLSTDMRLNMALPCRISVYTQQGRTMIGLITVDDVLNSRMIAYPFRLLMCCLVTDGGGALILAHSAQHPAEWAP